MVPMPAPDMDFQMSHPMEPIVAVGFLAFRYRRLLTTRRNSQGYYATPLPTPAPHPLRFAGYWPTADSGFSADTYDPFTPTSQPFDTIVDSGGMIHGALIAPQPPTPPAGPETSIPQNPSFHYHPCRWLGGPQCGGSAPGKNREMAEHLRVHHLFIGHERDIVSCEWDSCGQVMQRMNVARHIVSRHLLAVASCRSCGKQFSRPDVVARHERSCNGVHSV